MKLRLACVGEEVEGIDAHLLDSFEWLGVAPDRENDNGTMTVHRVHALAMRAKGGRSEWGSRAVHERGDGAGQLLT